jgi:hypothetical protein
MYDRSWVVFLLTCCSRVFRTRVTLWMMIEDEFIEISIPSKIVVVVIRFHIGVTYGGNPWSVDSSACTRGA